MVIIDVVHHFIFIDNCILIVGWTGVACYHIQQVCDSVNIQQYITFLGQYVDPDLDDLGPVLSRTNVFSEQVQLDRDIVLMLTLINGRKDLQKRHHTAYPRVQP